MLAYDFGRKWQQEHKLPRSEFHQLVEALEGVPVVDNKNVRYAPVLQKLREVKSLIEKLAHPAWDTNLGPEFCTAALALHEVIKSTPPGKSEWLDWMEPSDDPAAPKQTSSVQAPAGPAARSAAPVKLFYAYSHKDEKQRDRLEKHLTMLKRQGVIEEWHDRKIGAGIEWKGQIDKHLNEARVILLLVSADFLHSNYCYDVELKRALERHWAGEARVVPIIIKPCDWQHPPLNGLQALPKDGKPVVKWRTQDEAFTDVARGIRDAIQSLTASC